MQPYMRAVRAAFPHTVPVMTGYLCLGTAFGILLASRGYGLPWAFLMSLLIYAGSMQFVAVGLLAGGFAPLQAALVTLMVNARHLFYGLAMLDRFRGFGRARPYLIASLTDETFSLFCAVRPPQDVSPARFHLAVAGLNHLYWVGGSVLGSLAGAALTFNTRGIDFVMTALFVVIFLEQWLSRAGRVPALIGVSAALVCRLLFGPDVFLLPAMAALSAALLAVRSPLERRNPQ